MINKINIVTDPIVEAARLLTAPGIALCRVRIDTKRAFDPEWPTRSADPETFAGYSVGIQGGPISHYGKPGVYALVPVDLDDERVIELADAHLPETGMIDSRPGKPRSHRYYLVPIDSIPAWAESPSPAGEFCKSAFGHPGPFIKVFKRDGREAIKLQGTGGMVVCPPSTHERGQRTWEGGAPGEPAVVPFIDLWRAVCRLHLAAGGELPRGLGVDGPVVPSSRPTVGRGVVAVTTPKATAGKLAHTVSVAEPADIPPEWLDRIRQAEDRGTVVMDGESYPFAVREKRAEKWIDGIPDDDLSRSGHCGHTKFMYHLWTVANDYLIRGSDDLLNVAERYNAQLRNLAVVRPADGFEEWTGDELRHKVNEALAERVRPGYPPGRALPGRVVDGEPFRPRAWSDPTRLADDFLKEHQVRFLKNTPFIYDGKRYRAAGIDDFDATVRRFVERQANQQYDRDVKQWESDQARLHAEREEVSVRLRADGPGKEHDEARASSLGKRYAKLDKAKPKAVAPVVKKMVDETIGAIRARRQLPDDAKLDSWLSGDGPPVLCVANGLLDTVTRTLRPHSPDWFSTVAMPVAFDPVAFDPAAPDPAKMLSFLSEVMEGDADRIAVLQEVAGGCLDSNPGKWFAMLVGSGDNGKSVFVIVLRSLLGSENCSAVPLDQLTGNRFASFALLGKLANLIGDQSYFDSRDEGMLKTLTGGDLMLFEQKGRDIISDVNRAKIVMSCNTPPTFSDKTDAVWNRLVPVPFTYTVPADRKNPAMLTAGYWRDELPGLLNWALAGLDRLRAAGGHFTRSARCEALKNKHRKDSDPARAFLLERYTFTGSDDDRIPVKELFKQFQSWWAENNFTFRVTLPKFTDAVRHTFSIQESAVKKIDGKAVRVWVGLRATEEAEG